jgi:5'-3' exonuclease
MRPRSPEDGGERDGAGSGAAGLEVHLVDGTYELFRHFHAVPPHRDVRGRDVGAVRGVVASLLGILREGATHVGVATDHVIESFRNELWPGYKTGAGIEPALRQQFEPLEEACEALGLPVWAMVEHEADDALASAAAIADAEPAVGRVLICTPDKDLAQAVRGRRVVQLDRRRRIVFDEMGVIDRFGVPPSSIPDYLALVGDSADGFPGLAGWGARSAAAVLSRFRHLEAIPDDPRAWDLGLRGADRLAAVLARDRELSMLFRTLATLRTDSPVGQVKEWRWRGPTAAFTGIAERMRSADLLRRADEIADRLG